MTVRATFAMEQVEQMRLVRVIAKRLARLVDGNNADEPKRLRELDELVAMMRPLPGVSEST